MPRVKGTPQPRSHEPPPSSTVNLSTDNGNSSDSSIEFVGITTTTTRTTPTSFSSSSASSSSSSSSVPVQIHSRYARTKQELSENLMILLTSTTDEVQQGNGLLLAELPIHIVVPVGSSVPAEDNYDDHRSTSLSKQSVSSSSLPTNVPHRSLTETSILQTVAQLECPGALVYSKNDRLLNMYLCWNNSLFLSFKESSNAHIPTTSIIPDEDEEDDDIVITKQRSSPKRQRSNPSPSVDTSAWSITNVGDSFPFLRQDEPLSRFKLLFQTIHKLGTLDTIALVVHRNDNTVPSSSSSSSSSFLSLQLYALPSLFTPQVSTLYYPEPPKSIQQRQLAILFTFPRLFHTNKHPQTSESISSLLSCTDRTVYIAEPIIPYETRETFPESTVSSSSIPSPAAASSSVLSPLTEQDLYAAARPMSFELADEVDLSGSQYTRMKALLRPTLRRYQRCSLQWLLQRENQSEMELSLSDTELFDGVLYRKIPRSFITDLDSYGSRRRSNPVSLSSFSSASLGNSSSLTENDYMYLNPLWGILRTPNGTLCYNCWYSGILTMETPPLPPIYSLSSGIYADEMGLGKTVVTLALVTTSDNQTRIDELIRKTDKTNYYFTTKPQMDERKDTIITSSSVSITSSSSSSVASSSSRSHQDEQSIACICGATFVSIPPLQEMVHGRSSSPYTHTVSSSTVATVHSGKKSRRSSSASVLPTNVSLLSPNDTDNQPIDFTQPFVIGRTDGLPWIACSTCHRWQHVVCSGITDLQNTENLNQFLCTECECALVCGKPVLSTANIVVCPVPILAQWQSEIRKHIRAVTFDITDTNYIGVPIINNPPSFDTTKPLRVIYYAGIKSTIRALQKCTHALSYYVILLNNLSKEETKLQELYGEQLPWTNDKGNTEENGNTSDAFSPTETMEQEDIRLAEADAKTTGTAIGISDSAIIIAGDVYTIAIKDLVMKTNIILRGLRKAEYDMDTVPTRSDDDETMLELSDTSSIALTSTSSPKGLRNENTVRRRPWHWYTDIQSVLTQIRKAQSTATAASVRLAHSLSPRFLAEADIVITTYAALQDDINNADTVTTEILSASKQIGMIVDRMVGGSNGRNYSDNLTINDLHTMLTDRLVRMFKGDNTWYTDNEPVGSSHTNVTVNIGTTYTGNMVIDIDDSSPSATTTTTASRIVSSSTNHKSSRSFVHVQAFIDKLTKQGTIVHRVQCSIHGSTGGTTEPSASSSSSSTGGTPKYKDKTRLGVYIDSTTGTITGAASATSKGIFSLHDGLNIGSAGRKLRHAKKYRVVPTPLLYVYWYRCLLDEAQLIDVPTAKAAVMVRRLFAQHRWAISGTPLSRSVHDLFGIFLFLGVPIYHDKDIFHRYLLRSAENGNPHARLLLLRLANVFIWRTRKTDVADELGVPPLTDETIIITPSRIEEAFYKREFRRILKRIEPVLNTWRKEERDVQQRLSSSSSSSSSSTTLSSTSSASRNKQKWLLGDQILTRREQIIIMLPLLSIRQSCVHPQIASQTLRMLRKGVGSTGRIPLNDDDIDEDGPTTGHHRRGGHHRKTPMTMLQVLDSMIVKAKQDCEEAQRDIIASYNGLAGLEILRETWKKAMEHYETVINLGTAAASLGNKTDYQKNQIVVRIDPLPRIHALRNYLFCVQAMENQSNDNEIMRKQNEQHPEEKDAEEEEGTGNSNVTIIPITKRLHQEKLQREAQTLEDDFLRVSAYTVVTEMKQTEKVMQTLCGLLSCKVGTVADNSGIDTGSVSSSSLLSFAHRAVVVELDTEDSSSSSSSSSSGIFSNGTTTENSLGMNNAYRYGHSLPETDIRTLFATLLHISQPLETVVTVAVNTLLEQVATSTAFTKDILDQASSTALQSDDAHLFVTEGAGSLAWPVKSIDTLRLLVLHSLQELFKVREKAIATARMMLQPTSADLLLSSNCKVCRADWGKKGPVCTHCKAKTILRTYLAQLVGYRAQMLAGTEIDDVEMLKNGENMFPRGELSASGRRKRKRQSIIPGKDGNLQVWLQNETKQNDGEEDGPESATTMETDEISAKFAVPTALYRVLKFLGTAGKGFRMDIGEIITNAFVGPVSTLTGTMEMDNLSSSSSLPDIRLTIDNSTTIPALVQGAVEHRHTITDDLPRSSLPTNVKPVSSLAALSTSTKRITTRTVIGINAGLWLERTIMSLETEARRFLEGLWRRQADFLSNIDELTQSLTRMQLAAPQQVLNETEELYIVHESMIPSRIKELKLTLISSESDLRKAKGHLIYLLNIYAEETTGRTLMSSTSSSASSGTNIDSNDADSSTSTAPNGNAVPLQGPTDPNCLICLDTLGSQSNGQIVIIPQCGHRFCKPCLQRLMNLSRVRHEWYGRRPPTCPYDRRVFDESSLIYAVRKADDGTKERSRKGTNGSTVAVEKKEERKDDNNVENRSFDASSSLSSVDSKEGMSDTLDVSGTVTWEPSAILPAIENTFVTPSTLSSTLPSGPFTDASVTVPVGPPGTLQHLYSKSSLIHLHMLDDPELMVLGSYGSKIEALVRCIQALLTSKDVFLGEELRQNTNISLTERGTKKGEKKEDEIDKTTSFVSLSSSSSSSASSSIRMIAKESSLFDTLSIESIRLQRQQRPIQCLVFSQWDEALQIAEAACVRNNIACLRLKSTRHISEILQTFVSNPRITVLLLPFKSGAEGLNITCANHVFFLEPLLEPATEQQAIGRVHRMGQEQPTFVHRFIIKDTVEATILAINEHRLHKLQRVSGGNRRASVMLNMDRVKTGESNGTGGDIGEEESTGLSRYRWNQRNTNGTRYVSLHDRTEQFLRALAFPSFFTKPSERESKGKVLSNRNRSKRRMNKMEEEKDGNDDGDGDDDDDDDDEKDASTETNEGTVGVTRTDIITMFEGEMAFARQLESMGSTTQDSSSSSTPTTTSQNNASSTNDTTNRKKNYSEEKTKDEDNTECTPGLPIDMKKVMQEVRQNNEFWNTRIMYNGEFRLRLAILASYPNTIQSGSTTGTENTVVLFGRRVDSALAKQLIPSASQDSCES